MITEIRCSSLHRPMQCLGFLSLENLLVEEAGQPAKDGTACGELLSEMIRQGTPEPRIGTTASNGTFLDQDMWFYARDTYNTILQRAQGNRIETEERIDWILRNNLVTILNDLVVAGKIDHNWINAQKPQFGGKDVTQWHENAAACTGLFEMFVQYGLVNKL